MSQSSTFDKNFDAELEYTYGFFPFLLPDFLAFICLLQGICLPSQNGTGDNTGWTYCDLGCGQGLTLNVLAAGDEAGRYFGVDYNPHQIKNASSLAESAGLSNVEFIEESFAHLLQRDLPDFDVVVLHGIYSWISEGLRRNIVEFLAKKLKPGGICFVSYNSTISRASDLAFRELLQAGFRRGGDPTPANVAKSLALAEELAAKGALYFKQNEATLNRLKDLTRRNPTYVFHEYFNPTWKPFFHHEVAAELTEANLNFVGHASSAWNNSDLIIPSTLKTVFQSFDSVGEQELLKGIWTNEPFRRDIYIKGTPQRLSLSEQMENLKPLHFGLSKNRQECNLKVRVPAGVATLPDKPFTLLLDALKGAPVSGAFLRQCLPEGEIGDRDFVRALTTLLAVEYMELRTSPRSMTIVKRRFDQFNAAIARHVNKQQNLFVAATPKNRLAVRMTDVEYFLYCAHQSGAENRVSKAYRLLRMSGRSLNSSGQEVKDRQKAEGIIAEHERRFVTTILPRL